MDQALVATLGSFDGIHRGHQHLFARMQAFARQLGGRTLVLTFDPHPAELLRPEAAPPHLLPLAENVAYIYAAGIDAVEVEPFTRELAARTAGEYLRHLATDYGVTHLFLGYDHRFGSDGRQLSPEEYEVLAADCGIMLLRDVALLYGDERPISSSAIRRAITEGAMEEARGLLGRPHSCSGVVVSGQRLGRRLGFPTANLQHLDPLQLLPPAGVYACRVYSLPGSSHFVPQRGGMLYLGSRPTLGGDLEPSIEVHLFDFDSDIYGAELRVELLSRLAPERRFASLDELKAALSVYAEETRAYLAAQS